MKLGRKRAEALLGWYAFKGTDNTGSFADKGVAGHFKAFLQADDEMLDAFANFGLLSSIPPWIHRQMEKYVCLPYKIGNISSNEVPELREMLFALLMSTASANLRNARTSYIQSLFHGAGMEISNRTMSPSSTHH